MYLGKRRAEADKQKSLEDQRQRVIAFKRFFGTDEGKGIMFDLMNKYGVLNTHPKPAAGLPTDSHALARAEGSREVVLYLLSRANMDVATLDKMLRGEFV